MPRISVFSALLVAFLLPVGAKAQGIDVATPTAVTDQNRTGKVPYTASMGTGVENVDLSTGNLSVRIPLVHVKGRGLDYDITLQYDGNYWTPMSVPGNNSSIWANEARTYIPNLTGWSLNQPYITYAIGAPNFPCGQTSPDPPRNGGGQAPPPSPSPSPASGRFYYAYIFVDGEGHKNPLNVDEGDVICAGATGSNSSADYANSGPDTNAQGIWATMDQYVANPVKTANGTTYTPGGSAPNDLTTTVGGYGLANVTDVNANTEELTPGGLDTIGRTPLTLTQDNANQFHYTYYDPNGNPQQIVVHLETVNISTDFNVDSGTGYPIFEAVGIIQTIQSIDLPNGTSYTFTYENNTFGGLTSITFPSGGSVSYQYATVQNNDWSHRYVTQRTTNDGVTQATWNLSIANTTSNITITNPTPQNLSGYYATISTLTDPTPQQNQSVYTQTSGFTYDVKVYSGAATGNPLRHYQIAYFGYYPMPQNGSTSAPMINYQGLLPSQIVATNDTGQVSEIQYDYDSFTYSFKDCGSGGPSSGCLDTGMVTRTGNATRGNVTGIREYDWRAGAPGALLRQTLKTYLYNQNSGYVGTNVVDRVASDSVYDGSQVCYGGQTCSANLIAQTNYSYDQDGVGYRGRLTETSKWLNLGNTWLNTTYAYDGYGNITSSTDPKGNTSKWSYSDSWASNNGNCVPPQNQSSYMTAATNALSQTTSYTYAPCTGQPVTMQDPNDTLAKRNGLQVAYDLMDRIIDVYAADGGHTHTIYNDQAQTVETQTYLASSNVENKLTVLDGLGRTKEAELLSDPYGTDYVTTTYDAMGRTWCVSNPYRSQSGGGTCTSYDALSRPTVVTEQDGSSKSSSYSGNVTTSTDEIGNSWARAEDALGRLTNVTEPSSFKTAYTYDTLGNLLTVDQLGNSSTDAARTRSFSYDSLSRLLTSTNPENGTIGYAYVNAAGGLCCGDITLPCSKTDARGITTSYTYDALKRLTQKSYNDGVTNTNLYGYDSSSIGFVPVPQNGRGDVSVSLVNTIGRLAYASSTNSGTLDAFSYDAMGRLVNQWSSAPSFNNNNGTVAAVSAGYDLAGNQTSLTYPDGRKVSQSIDGAGRVSSVNYAAWNGTTHTSSYLTVIGGSNGYDAAGHLLGATFGNGVQVVSDYDNRERLHDLSYAGLGNVTLWGRQYVWRPNSNLQSTTDWITKTQRVFTYDNLNRLTSAQDFLNTVTGDGTASAGAGAAECTSTSGGASSSGASPQWTDPDDSNVLLNPSEPANGAGWGFSQVSVQPNSLLAPDGSMTAHTVSATPNADSYIFDTADSDTEFSGLPMTGSVWLKSLTGSSRSIELSINANNAQGVQTVASKAVQLTTNWQQYQLSGMTPSTLNAVNLVIGGAGSFTSGAVGLWQPTLENTGVANSTITNYQAYSQRFQQWTLVTGSNTPGSGVVDNAAVAPDGTQTAATVTPPTSCSGTSSPCAPDFNMWLPVSNPAAFSNAAVTGSIWMRVASGATNVSLTLVETGSAGETPLGAQVVPLTTDWQRFQVSGTTQQTLSFLELQIGGAGTLKSGQSIQVWGAQLELASVAGPYVPTGSVPASAGTGITNILPYSQTFTNWAQHDASITGTVGAPDGSNTAAQVTAASTPSTGETNVDGYISEDVQNPTLYDAATITGSVFLRMPSGSGTIGVSFGTYTAASGFQYFMTQNFKVDTTWRRFTITGKVPNALQRLFLVVGGSGSFAKGQVVDIWGGQLELASTAGPYVATNGLPILAAPEIANILPSSQQISGPGWAAAAGSEFLNQATAPDNTNTAAVFSAWTTSSDSAILDYVSNPSYYDGQTMTASVYLRVASGTQPLNLYLASVGDQTGLVTAGQQLVTVTNSWQRFEVTGTVQNGLSQLFFQIGGGGTLNNGESIQIWGAQMNPGSSAAPSQATSCTTANPYSGGSGTLLPNGLNEAYVYDSFGNILQKGSFTASYTANNQLTNGLYDVAGNLLSNYLSPMTWDAENRLISVGGATYVYDANGNRVEKQGVGVTDTVYFGGRPVARLSSGQWTDLIYGPNGMLGEVAGTENADTSYRLLDHLGTEVGTVDSTGIMTNPLDYTPFGQVFSGSTNDPYLFTGKERDTESGNDYFGARYYASNMGRWMSPDPSPAGLNIANPQSWNLYNYVLNNPLRLVDRNGMWATDVHGQIVTYSLQNYVSAGELNSLRGRQYSMDADQSNQNNHAMANQGQSSQDALSAMWGIVSQDMSAVAVGKNSDGTLDNFGLYNLGGAMHTLEDFTSPMHTDSSFMPMEWDGGYWPPSKWGPGFTHVSGEAAPYQDWSRIGFAIRLTMAAWLQSGAPCEAGKQCLTEQNFNSEVEKNITSYVNNTYHGSQGSPIQEDMARQCALGNPAACN